MGMPWAQIGKTVALGIDNLIANKGAQNTRELQLDAGNRSIATNEEWRRNLGGMYDPYRQMGGNALQRLASRVGVDASGFRGYAVPPMTQGQASQQGQQQNQGGIVPIIGGTDGGTYRGGGNSGFTGLGVPRDGSLGPLPPGPKENNPYGEIPVENPISPLPQQNAPQMNTFDAARFFLDQQQGGNNGGGSFRAEPFVPQGVGEGVRTTVDQRGLDFAQRRATDAAMQRLKALGLGDSGASVNAVAELGAGLGNQYYNEAWQRGNTEAARRSQNNIALQQLALQGRGQDMQFAGQQDNQRLNLMRMGLEAQGQGFGQDLANRNYGLNANQQGFNQGMANRQFDLTNRQFDWTQLQGNRNYDTQLRNEQIALEQYLANMGFQGTNSLAQLGTGINTNIANTQIDMGNAQAAAEAAKWNNARNAHNSAFNTWMPMMNQDFSNAGGSTGSGGAGMPGGGGGMFGGTGSIGSMFGNSSQLFSNA